MRQPIQVLVFAYRKSEPSDFEFLILKRSDSDLWQGIAGGVEESETTEQAALRETLEETGIAASQVVPLDSITSVPKNVFRDAHHWSDDLYVVAEHAFGVDVSGQSVQLSPEHSEYRWCGYKEATERLRFDGNKTALWELNERLKI